MKRPGTGSCGRVFSCGAPTSGTALPGSSAPDAVGGQPRRADASTWVTLAVVALIRGHVADLPMAVFVVVPAHETVTPLPGLLDVSKPPARIAGHILERAEPRLDEGVVVRDARPAVAGLDAQAMQLGPKRQ